MGNSLPIPYVSQKDKNTAAYSFNDCGPACLAMMIQATGQQVTVDGIYRKAGINNRGPLLVTTVRNAGNIFGLNLQYVDASSGCSLSKVQEWIDDGRPSLVLIDYAPIMRAKLFQSQIIGGHFITVVGYDDDSVLVHDPYWDGNGGANRVWPKQVFEAAWYAPGTQYQKVVLVPAKGIAKPQNPTFAIPTSVSRRLRAKAQYEGSAAPRVTNQQEYFKALEWLGNWGQDTVPYTFQAGDSLGLIATKYYGGAQFFTTLGVFNGIDNLNSLQPGQQILIPLPSEGSTPGSTAQAAFTNQQVINAFYETFQERGLPDKYWDAIIAAGIESIADSRNARYSGPDINTLSGLSSEMKSSILLKLASNP